MQSHHVEPVELRIDAAERGRQNHEVFRDVVGEAERREAAAGHEELLADVDDLEELRGVAVEVDHVARLLGGLRARVHRHGHVGLSKRGGVVRAVAGHRHEVALGLIPADHGELGLRCRLGEKVVDAGLGGNRGRGQWVVSGDHHGADAHGPEVFESLGQTTFHDVLEFNHPEHAVAVGDHQRRGTRLGDGVADGVDLRVDGAAGLFNVPHDGVAGALADLAAVEINAAHSCLGRERHKRRAEAGDVAGPEAVPLLGQHHDRAALGCLVGEARQLCRIGKIPFRDAGRGQKRRRLPVAERDRAGLVEEQHVDVASRLDRPSARGQHVGPHHPVDSSDPDRREKAADCGGSEADEERRKHGEADRVAATGRRGGVERERQERGGDDEKHQRQPREQDVERDLVGSLLPLGSLDEADHPVEEAVAGVGGDPHDEPVGEQPRATGHGVAVAAALADHWRALTRDGALVHACHALDHFAVAGHEIARLDQHVVASPQARRGHGLHRRVAPRAGKPLGRGVLPHRSHRIGLGAAPALGKRLGERREQHRGPEADGHRGDERGRFAPRLPTAAEDRQHGDQQRAHLDGEHYRRPHHPPRVEFGKRTGNGGRNGLPVGEEPLRFLGATGREGGAGHGVPPASGWSASAIGPRARAGTNDSAPTRLTTPATRRMKSSPCVGRVPIDAATGRLAASDPPRMTKQITDNTRPTAIAAASPRVQKVLVASRPPKAEPLLLAALVKA